MNRPFVQTGNSITMDEIAPSPGMKSPTATGLGARLRRTRESLNLTTREVATRLRLSPSLIDMMEEENYSKGPPATFMRGYIRSYGRFLNLNESEINSNLEKLFQSEPSTPVPLSLTTQQKSRQPDLYLRWASYIVIGLLLMLVIVWWVSHPRYNEPEKTEATVSTAETTIPTNNETQQPVIAPLVTAPTLAPLAGTQPPAAPQKPETPSTPDLSTKPALTPTTTPLQSKPSSDEEVDDISSAAVHSAADKNVQTDTSQGTEPDLDSVDNEEAADSIY